MTGRDVHPKKYTPLQTMCDKQNKDPAHAETMVSLIKCMDPPSLLNKIGSSREGTFAHMLAGAGAQDALWCALDACDYYIGHEFTKCLLNTRDIDGCGVVDRVAFIISSLYACLFSRRFCLYDFNIVGFPQKFKIEN